MWLSHRPAKGDGVVGDTTEHVSDTSMDRLLNNSKICNFNFGSLVKTGREFSF